MIFAPAIMRTLDQRRSATLPQPTATAPPSLAETIQSAVAKQITDELQGELSRKKKAADQPAPTGSAIPEKSIAVLPFANLSRDPDNAYFVEGIQDEILTRLSKIADLKVISRTSTQKYKSAPDNLRDVARELGVANILEGSVQKSNDQVRVNVQLINALTDAHLWADTYDRKLTDMFAVESEIAKTIAETLQARLTGSEKTAISKKPTENPEAYELYLKGRFFWNKRTADDLRKSIDYFNQADTKRIRTMPRRMPVSRKRGSCSRLSMEARRKIVFRKPRLRRRKRSHWMTPRPVPMLLWPRSRDSTDSIIPARSASTNGLCN